MCRCPCPASVCLPLRAGAGRGQCRTGGRQHPGGRNGRYHPAARLRRSAGFPARGAYPAPAGRAVLDRSGRGVGSCPRGSLAPRDAVRSAGRAWSASAGCCPTALDSAGAFADFLPAGASQCRCRRTGWRTDGLYHPARRRGGAGQSDCRRRANRHDLSFPAEPAVCRYAPGHGYAVCTRRQPYAGNGWRGADAGIPERGGIPVRRRDPGSLRHLPVTFAAQRTGAPLPDGGNRQLGAQGVYRVSGSDHLSSFGAAGMPERPVRTCGLASHEGHQVCRRQSAPGRRQCGVRFAGLRGGGG